MSSSKLNEVNYCSMERMNSAYNNLNIMRKQRILCDLNIKIENKTVPVHKVVLASNSAFFENMFLEEFNNSGIEEVSFDEIPPNGLELLIEYMYTLNLTINEENVKDLLLASKILIFDDVYYECIEFMKGIINVKNCFAFYCIAFLNNVDELIEISLPLILDNFAEVIKSKEFLLLSNDQILKLVQSKHINATEITVFESIILWVKHDLENRSLFLPELIKSVNMSMIPLSYFIKNIEKEEIVVSHCKNFLYESFKMYAINKTEIQMSAYYSTRRNCSNNQLILISPWQVGEFRLEYITTGDDLCSTIKFTWESDNSIILNNGKIFCTDYTVTKKKWSARIFNGERNRWTSMGNFQFVDVGSYFSSLVELHGCIYMMSSLGHFKCYDIKQKSWLDLESLENGDAFRYLVVFNELIYCIMNCGVSQYNLSTNTWNSISQSTGSKWYGFTACSLNGFLYVMGGDKKQNTDRKSTMKFNIYTGTWSDIADMNVPRRNAGAVAVNGLIYVFGGINCDSYEIYDPHDDKWTLSNNRLTSKEHYRTHAFVLNPSVNINPENILDYYSLNSDNTSLNLNVIK